MEKEAVKKERPKWVKIIYFISWMPLAAAFVASVYCSFAGFDFLGSMLYALDAFFASMVLFIVVGSVIAVFPLCLLFQICCHLWYNTDFSERHSKKLLIGSAVGVMAAIILAIVLIVFN